MQGMQPSSSPQFILSLSPQNPFLCVYLSAHTAFLSYTFDEQGCGITEQSGNKILKHTLARLMFAIYSF